MKIRDLKEEHPRIYERALECQKEQGNTPNDEHDLSKGCDKGNFKWQNTPEGFAFWQHINTYNFHVFYDKYPEAESTELTSLPEKWCIKTTSENIQILNNWRTDKGCLSSGHINGYLHTPWSDTKVKGWNLNKIEPGFKEITFEQFKKWVLKEKTGSSFYMNKWHKCIAHSKVYYFKPIEGLTIGNSILPNGNFCPTDHWCRKFDSIEILEDLSEIQEYLPDGHRDKIKKATITEGLENLVPRKWVEILKANTNSTSEDELLLLG